MSLASAGLFYGLKFGTLLAWFLDYKSECPMNGSNIVLVFAPIAILIVLMPAFEVSTFPNIIKGFVIGLYLGISFIGILKMIEEVWS